MTIEQEIALRAIALAVKRGLKHVIDNPGKCAWVKIEHLSLGSLTEILFIPPMPKGMQ